MAAAHAHGFEADGVVGVLEAVEQGAHDARPGHAEGVAQSDRAAVGVELVVVDAQLVGRRQHLGGEGLVDLPVVDVVHGQDMAYWNDTYTISGDSASTCSGVAIGLSSS